GTAQGRQRAEGPRQVLADLLAVLGHGLVAPLRGGRQEARVVAALLRDVPTQRGAPLAVCETVVALGALALGGAVLVREQHPSSAFHTRRRQTINMSQRAQQASPPGRHVRTRRLSSDG
ncbi:unnamed protein product, partial [Prorocentrum cordatum]